MAKKTPAYAGEMRLILKIVSKHKGRLRNND